MRSNFGEIIDPADGCEPFDGTRKTFIVRCLNAAACLYGILSADEFIDLYNRYAKSHESPVSDELAAEELESVAKAAVDASEHEFTDSEIAQDVWFRLWTHPKTGERLVIYAYLAEVNDDDLEVGETADDWIAGEIDAHRAKWVTKSMKILPEEEFFDFEDPGWGDEGEAIDKLACFISGRDDLEAEDNFGLFEAAKIVAALRMDGPTLLRAVDAAADFGCEVQDLESYEELVVILAQVVPVVRAWDYRGRSQVELVTGKIWKNLPTGNLPQYSYWKALHGEMDDADEGSEKDWEEDAWDTGRLEFDDYIDFDKLPPPKSLDEPFDFKKVKDPAWREKTLRDYENIRDMTSAFMRECIACKVFGPERSAVARRLGFTREEMKGPLRRALDIVVGDYAIMMDDKDGEPAIKRIIAEGGELEPWQKVAAGYYGQYRYTWLEVVSVKSGFGMKCKNLMTGKDIFLMEKSLSSHPDAKGMTICAGIAPMGEVWLVLGAIHPAGFENPSTILKIVLSHLGLSSELPVELSFGDQARFAAETIRRIHANGRFETVGCGRG
ncbi:MAG: hypothetical protein K6F50_04765 [Kiritimatiellae bacterium]|nr:hypothetical protein [Kiritimatiellia bacterium]